jgi:hypothetical protein
MDVLTDGFVYARRNAEALALMERRSGIALQRTIQ